MANDGGSRDIQVGLLNDVQNALARAASMPDVDARRGPLHAVRSVRFVSALADHLRTKFQKEQDVVVLSKDFAGNRERFGLNELMLDILACEVRDVPAAVSTRKLTVVTKGILAVESEFARNSRQAIRDFNKLVLCHAEYKVFIGPRISNERAVMTLLGEAAMYCTGCVLIALVPHPSDWSRERPMQAVVGYTWRSAKWQKISVEQDGAAPN